MSITAAQFQKEITIDKRLYFENCKSNYSAYVSMAHKLFPDIYKKIEEMDSEGDPLTKFNSKAVGLRVNEISEIEILINAVQNNVYTPGSYERLALLYGKRKNYSAAYLVCLKWFELDFWKLPNTAGGSLRILERMEKLENRINKNTSKGYNK